MSANQKSYQVASYVRLSREDGDKVLSDSIANQQAMIADYIKTHDNLSLAAEYVDDGYSGTNFDRPQFQKMMEDIKKKKVNCVIVKDLSRLGRNYIETGRYLENIFPFYGIRFISILDHYDNADENGDSDQIIIPFKNLINDAYCRDISLKIRSHFEVKRKNGQFIGSFAPYGYQKDPKNHNHLIIDPSAAEIVRSIFRYKFQGLSNQKIADELNEMGALPPYEYKRMQGDNYDCGYRSGEDARWDPGTVLRILTNEMYTGTMVQGLDRKINYRIKHRQAIDKEDWIRVPDMHEAIIDGDVFARIQELLQKDTRAAPGKSSVYLFSGYLRCGDCHQNMVRRNVNKKGKKYIYHHCSTYKNKLGCTSHLISDECLKDIVLTAIQKQIELVVKAEDIISAIDQLPEDNFAVRSISNQISLLMEEMERYKTLKTRLYIDKTDGVIEDEEYKDLNRRFSKKLKEAEEKCDALTRKRQSLLEKETHLQPWLEEFKKYRNITELNRQIIVALIEEIVIYSKTEVNIVFRYHDELQDIFSVAGLTGEEEVPCDT